MADDDVLAPEVGDPVLTVADDDDWGEGTIEAVGQELGQNLYEVTVEGRVIQVYWSNDDECWVESE